MANHPIPSPYVTKNRPFAIMIGDRTQQMMESVSAALSVPQTKLPHNWPRNRADSSSWYLLHGDNGRLFFAIDSGCANRLTQLLHGRHERTKEKAPYLYEAWYFWW